MTSEPCEHDRGAVESFYSELFPKGVFIKCSKCGYQKWCKILD